MALKKWEPLQELDDLFERTRRGFGLMPWRGRDLMAELDWAPRVDIGEADGTYLIKAEIPGVKKEDVKVSIDSGVLTLAGERREEEESRGLQLHRVERFHGCFSRSFTLPPTVDPQQVKASFQDGVLTVTLAKRPGSEGSAQQVPVE
jgi:HSP20 family protein